VELDLPGGTWRDYWRLIIMCWSSEEKTRAMNPDYYLVLPWHFKTEFLEREKAELDKGTGFIFPLPDIEIVKK
jgi:hypothetical protein